MLGPLVPPGGISIITGASGAGKTTFIADLVRRILGRKPVFGYTPDDVPFVGFVGTDRRWAVARAWFDAAGVQEGPRFRAHCLQDDIPGFNWARARKEDNHPELFEEAIDILKAPEHSLIFYDPIALYLGRRLNDYTETAAAIGPLNAICVKRKMTVIGSCHVPKARNDPKDGFLRYQDRALGSTAIASYTNTQFYVVGPEETKKPYHVIGYVAHNLPPAEVKFARGPDGLLAPLSTEQAQVLDVVEEADVDLVFKEIPEPHEVPITAKELLRQAEARGVGRSPTYDRLKKWKDAGLIEQPSEGLWRKVRQN